MTKTRQSQIKATAKYQAGKSRFTMLFDKDERRRIEGAIYPNNLSDYIRGLIYADLGEKCLNGQNKRALKGLTLMKKDI